MNCTSLPFRRLVYIYALVWLFLNGLTLTAQPIKFSSVRLPANLDLQWITDIRQDQQGYIWMTTFTGLHRYNGYEWTSYFRNPNNPYSSFDNGLEQVCPSRDGSIWVGTQGWGLERRDPQTGRVQRFLLANRPDRNKEENYITVLQEGRDGTLWIGTFNGLYSRDPKTGRFTHYINNPRDPYSISFNQIKAILEDHSGAIWVGTGESTITTPDQGGLNRLDRRTGRFTRYRHDPFDPNSLFDNRVRAIFEDSRGTLWVGTWGDGLHTMDRQTGRFTRHQYDPKRPDKLSRPYLKNHKGEAHWGISYITEDATGNIWIGAYNGGLNRYNPRTQQITHYDANQGAEEERVENNQWSICLSRDGVLWMGSSDGRLMKGVPAHDQLPNFHVSDIVTLGITSFCEYQPGKFWLGTYAGLRDQTFDTINAESFFRQAAQQTTLLTDHIQSFYEDRLGSYWIGTLNAGLYRYTPQTGRFAKFFNDTQVNSSRFKVVRAYNSGQLPHVLNSIGNSTAVMTTYEDRAGGFWVLTSKGLYKMSRQTEQFIHYQHNPADSTTISPGMGVCALEDRAGQLWVGTSEGLNRMNRRTGKFTHYLDGKYIVQVGEDASGIMWVVVGEGFLFRFDAKQNRFLPFLNPYSGTKLANVASFVEDDQHNLWVAASQGFYCIDRSRSSLRLFGTAYGFKGYSSVCFASAKKSRDGHLLFGGRHGYYTLSPAQLLTKQKAPLPLVMSSFSIDNKLVIPDPDGPLKELVTQTRAFELKYDQNTFSFNFAALDYVQTEEVQYSFYLQNYESAWRSAGSERKASFYNVPPGEYLFNVKAGTVNTGWIEKQIKVIIHPPWWQTWWFRLLAIVSVLLIAFAAARYYTRYRLNRQRTEIKRVLQAQEEERQRLAADLHDDLGATLSAIKGQLETRSASRGEASTPVLLMDKAIRDLRMISHNLMPPEFTVLGLTETIRETVKRAEASSGLKFLFITYGKEQRLDQETELTIYRIVLELINNTIKHAKAGQVTVQLIFYPHHVTLLVEDDGRGYAIIDQQEPSGIGLRNIRSRVAFLNSTLQVDSGKNGTTITLEIPLKKQLHGPKGKRYQHTDR